MASVASGGTADRITARILFKVLRAGSGTPARYSSTSVGATLPFEAAPRSPEFTCFIQVLPGFSGLHQLTGYKRKETNHDAGDNPITGPISAIISLGESGKGIDFIISASRA
jgi:hypothetical protein